MGAARRDLIAKGLGSYDEEGTFFTTVPGGMETRAEWMSLEEEAALARSVQRRDAAQHRERLPVTDRNRRMGGVRRARF